MFLTTYIHVMPWAWFSVAFEYFSWRKKGHVPSINFQPYNLSCNFSRVEGNQ